MMKTDMQDSPKEWASAVKKFLLVLQDLAEEFALPVLMTNQVTANFASEYVLCGSECILSSNCLTFPIPMSQRSRQWALSLE